MKTSLKIKDVDKKYYLFFKNKFFYLKILDYFLLLSYDVPISKLTVVSILL